MRVRKRWRLRHFFEHSKSFLSQALSEVFESLQSQSFRKQSSSQLAAGPRSGATRPPDIGLRPYGLGLKAVTLMDSQLPSSTDEVDKLDLQYLHFNAPDFISSLQYGQVFVFALAIFNFPYIK
jgi:hypothetical protein